MSADKVVRTELITPEPAEALANLLGTDIPRPRRCERDLAPGPVDGRAGDAEQVSDSATDGSN